jgi:hypothetical protein
MNEPSVLALLSVNIEYPIACDNIDGCSYEELNRVDFLAV